MVTASGKPQQFPKFCALCTPAGRKYPNNYLLPIHLEWSDWEEEEKDFSKQEKEEKEKQERGDWDGTIQKQKEGKEIKLKQINMKIPKLGPETMSPLKTKDTQLHPTAHQYAG